MSVSVFSGYPFAVTVGVEEPEHTFGLLEGLDETVQENPVEASIPELDATLVVFVKGVHGALLCGEIPGAYRHERLAKRTSLPSDGGYQGEALAS